MLRAPIHTKAGLRRLHVSQIPTLLKSRRILTSTKTLQNKTNITHPLSNQNFVTVSRQISKAVASTVSGAQPLFNNQYDEYGKIEELHPLESSFTDDERVNVFSGFHDEALSI